jgi:hypothetical protein
LIVRNRGDKSRRVGLPEHYALSTLPSSTQAFRVSKQPAQEVPPGGEVVFETPTATSGNTSTTTQQQCVIEIDEVLYVVSVDRKTD